MAVKKTGEWNTARAASKNLATRVRAAKRRAIRTEVQRFRGEIIKTFNTSGASAGAAWKPLKPSTVANKRAGGSKPLIGRGDLRNSVVVRGREGAFFVGVPSKATSKTGQRMVDIAAVHEFGKIIVIPVTDKMRRFLMARLKESGGGIGGGGGGGLAAGSVLIIKIPQRSFLQSTFDKQYGRPEDVQERMLSDMARQLGPGWSEQATVRVSRQF